MSWMKRLGGRLPDFEAVIKRFPIPVAIMAGFTIWIIANNHFNFWSYKDEQYIASGFILAGYVAVIVALIAEARKTSGVFRAVVGLCVAIIAFLLCYFSRELDFTALMAIGGTIIFLGNASAWRRGREDRNVWNFTQKLWTGALFAAVGSVIFLLGMFAISEAVRALFGVNLNDLTIETILPIGLAFLAPVYWLGTLPKYGEADDLTELSFEARGLSFLGTWMLAPLVIIYALIVLAYGAKVLIQWDLPKGEIAQLVSPFIGVGMLVWLMLEPKILKESSFVRFYRAAWHWIMLPAAILLGVAVFVRIREYGYTVERFFLSLIVVWAVVQSLWFVAMLKAKRDIRIPTVLAAMLLMLGAFAAQPISTMNQFQRAQEAKRELPVFEADVIRKNPELAKQFLGGMTYLIRQQDEGRFKRLLPNYTMPKNAYGTEYKALLKSLGLDQVDINGRNRYSNYSLTSEPILDVLADSQIFFGPSIVLYENRKVSSPEGIVISQDGRNIVLSIEDDVYRVDLTETLSSLELVGDNDWQVDTVVPPISITSDDGVEAKLIILNGKLNFKNDTVHDGNISFAVIVPN